MKNINKGRQLVARATIVLAGLTACFAFAGVVKSGIPKGKNDSQETLDKLARIGRALQLYRQEYGSLPVNERVDYIDAGLPFSLSVLGTDPSKNWYVDPTNFQVPNPSVPGLYTFRELYYRREAYGTRLLPPMGDVYKRRGEQFPVLEATDWIPEEVWQQNADVTLPVLRLDGTVEMIKRNTRNMWEVWEK